MADHTAENWPTTWRKKPVEIEAFQITPYPGDNADAVADWCGGRVTWGGKEIASGEPQPQVYIDTLEGTMKAQVGDYVIRGVQGEFYPCKPDIFLATYEQADSPTRPENPSAPNDQPDDQAGDGGDRDTDHHQENQQLDGTQVGDGRVHGPDGTSS